MYWTDKTTMFNGMAICSATNAPCARYLVNLVIGEVCRDTWGTGMRVLSYGGV